MYRNMNFNTKPISKISSNNNLVRNNVCRFQSSFQAAEIDVKINIKGNVKEKKEQKVTCK